MFGIVSKHLHFHSERMDEIWMDAWCKQYVIIMNGWMGGLT
jgi:hypothetical protein